MAIELPDPGNGIPEDKTGNDEWTNMKIVRENFKDPKNSASRLVGSGIDQVPLAQQTLKAAFSTAPLPVQTNNEGFDCNSIGAGEQAFVSVLGNVNTPPAVLSGTGDNYRIIGLDTNGGRIVQIALGYGNTTGEMFIREGKGETWSAWKSVASQRRTYNQTASASPNVVVSPDGTLSRASSSLRYKDVIADLELDDSRYERVMNTRAIVYRSKSELDPPDWHFMSFAAEELAECDPALTQWRTHGFDEEKGVWGELAEPIAEGINLNAICAVLHATNVKQGKLIQSLEQRVTALEGE